MSIKIGVQFNVKQVQDQVGRLKADLQDKVIAQALGKTAEKARAEMTRQITREFAIKAKDVRPSIYIDRPRMGKVSMITIKAFPSKKGKRSRNVMLFGARPAPGSEKRRVKVKLPDGRWVMRVVSVGGGVSVKIRKGESRKVIKGAFIGNKGRTVFMREGDGRLPIKGVQTIDVPQMFNTKRINEAVVRKILQDFPRELNRLVAYRLSKL
ncbi:hypothetical protein AZ34_11920 [Hylemonella gracilis str. Niagara R]|uniref:Uncharacterized protein n=1 Tax=Hylemonella gracilis str. Niagara R TaxID=1458275 RepID=A0A016XMT3_9BURK|nr:phage tail protein [Hylemonella gracilis]EYC52892.1 hypothetical protein AZ34_11920 [Hylemonella gracilis str. Niagara R]